MPLGDGAGLVVRSVARWRLLALLPNGAVTSQDLPFTCASADCHLRADARGDRIAFLVVDRNPPPSCPAG